MTPDYANKSAAATSAQARRKQILGMALLVLLVGGGVAGAWWKWHVPTPDEPLVDVPTNRFGMMRFQQPVVAAPRDGVRNTGSADAPKYEVRNGDARMIVSKAKNGEWEYIWRYQPDNVTPRDERAFLGVKYRSSMLALTEDQKKQLDALPSYVGGMVVSEPNQKKMKDEFQAYVSSKDSDKPAKDASLVKSLADVAKESEQATRDALTAYTAKVKAILTPEQIAKLAPGNNPAPGRGTTGAPTTAPGR